MQVRASARRRCPKCRIIRRRNGLGKPTLRVVCENPRHKARQG